MTKAETLRFLNKTVSLCNGREVNINQNIEETELDPLGFVLLFASLNLDEELFKNFTTLSVKDIINMCVINHD